MTYWDEVRLQKLIDDGVEETLSLEYKSAASIDRQNNKTDEITKDISSMANSSGGTIIYGIKEFDQSDKRHLPQNIDPVDSTKYSKEWLEHVIGNIRPRIASVIIHPVRLAGSGNQVCYVVEIPEGTTAHQAKDLRYYKRYNFEAVPMEDYEIRLLMNRLAHPEVAVEFGYMIIHRESENHEYELKVSISNNGSRITRYFMLEYTFPAIANGKIHGEHRGEHIIQHQTPSGDTVVYYRSRDVLFPKETRTISKEIVFRYKVNQEIYGKLRVGERQGIPHDLYWKLYADDMPFKEGTIPFSNFHEF